jgi:hypothetical protein
MSAATVRIKKQRCVRIIYRRLYFLPLNKIKETHNWSVPGRGLETKMQENLILSLEHLSEEAPVQMRLNVIVDFLPFITLRLHLYSTMVALIIDALDGKRKYKKPLGIVGSDTKKERSDDIVTDIDVIEGTMNTQSVSLSLPMDIFPSILSFCPLSTLSKIRCISKAFRDDFVTTESAFRCNRVDKNVEQWSEIAVKKFIGTGWGQTLGATIEKAIQAAETLFFETVPFLEGQGTNEDDDHQIGGATILLAQGYDQIKVKALLREEPVVIGENWRIEARHKLVSLSEAFKEIKMGIHEGNDKARNILMTASSEALVHIAECDVSIQQYAGIPRQMIAMQLLTFETVKNEFSAVAAVVNHSAIRW